MAVISKITTALARIPGRRYITGGESRIPDAEIKWRTVGEGPHQRSGLYSGGDVDRTSLNGFKEFRVVERRSIIPLDRAVEVFTAEMFELITGSNSVGLSEEVDRRLANVLIGLGATSVRFYEDIQVDVGAEAGRPIDGRLVVRHSFSFDDRVGVCRRDHLDNEETTVPDIEILRQRTDFYIKNGRERIFFMEKLGPSGRYVGVEFPEEIFTSKDIDEGTHTEKVMRSRIIAVVVNLLSAAGQARETLDRNIIQNLMVRLSIKIETADKTVGAIREVMGRELREKILGEKAGEVHMFFVDSEQGELVAEGNYDDPIVAARFPHDVSVSRERSRYLISERRGNGIADYFYRHFTDNQTRPLLLLQDEHFDAISGVRWRRPAGERGSLMVAPLLRREGKLMGVVVLTSPQSNAFTFNQFHSFSTMTRSLGLAMENAGVQEKLQEQVRLDPKFGHLGIYNANYLEAYLAKLVRERMPFTLYFVDIDKFGDLNNAWMHTDVDYVLGEILKRIQGAPREDDTAKTFRHGGEEVVLVVEGISNLKSAEATGLRMMRNVGQRIQVSIPYETESQIDATIEYHSKHKAKYSDHGIISMTKISDRRRPGKWILSVVVQKTISVGCVAWTPGDAVSSESILAEANAAEGRAKKGGRDRMFVRKYGQTGETGIGITRDGQRSESF